MAISAEIRKVDPDQQLVFGWAWVSTDDDGNLVVDSHDEVIEPAEIEAAAYDYVLEARDAGEMHEGEAVGKMVESLLLTPEKAEAMGLGKTEATAWWVGMYIEDPEVFGKIKQGDYKMFSVQGIASEVAEVFDEAVA